MPEKHITQQAYGFHAALVEFPEVADAHLCGGSTPSFIAALVLIASLLSGAAYLLAGAEDAVNSRAAVIKAYAPVSGWER